MVVLLLPLLCHGSYLCFWDKQKRSANWSERKDKKQQLISAFWSETITRTHGEPFGPLIGVKFATGSRLVQHMHDARGLWNYMSNNVILIIDANHLNAIKYKITSLYRGGSQICTKYKMLHNVLYQGLESRTLLILSDKYCPCDAEAE